MTLEAAETAELRVTAATWLTGGGAFAAIGAAISGSGSRSDLSRCSRGACLLRRRLLQMQMRCWSVAAALRWSMQLRMLSLLAFDRRSSDKCVCCASSAEQRYNRREDEATDRRSRPSQEAHPPLSQSPGRKRKAETRQHWECCERSNRRRPWLGECRLQQWQLVREDLQRVRGAEGWMRECEAAGASVPALSTIRKLLFRCTSDTTLMRRCRLRGAAYECRANKSSSSSSSSSSSAPFGCLHSASVRTSGCDTLRVYDCTLVWCRMRSLRVCCCCLSLWLFCRFRLPFTFCVAAAATRTAALCQRHHQATAIHTHQMQPLE